MPMAERSAYVVKAAESGTGGSSALECFKAVADTDAAVTCRHAPGELEIDGSLERIDALIHNPAANPEFSSVYLTTASPEHGACPRLC
jgi:hypothetical protein